MAKAKTAAKSVAWKSLQHAHGPATRVPVQIDQLITGKPAADGESPYWVLRNTLVGTGPSGQGAWFGASAPAVTLLLDSVSQAVDPASVFELTGEILGGDQLRGWLAAPDAPLAGDEKAAHDAAIEKKAALFDGLASKQGVVRGAAAMALAMVPALSKESVPALVDMSAKDGDEIARASALLALGRLGAGDAAAVKAIEGGRAASGPPLVRGAAGMAWLRHDAKRSFEQARGEIESWLGFSPGAGVELPWFRVALWYRTMPLGPNATARALGALGRARGQEGALALADVLVGLDEPGASGALESQASKVMLSLGGFPSEPTTTVMLPEDLSAEQRPIATKLAGTRLVAAGNHGLPQSGEVRRRWIGVDPPGPIDRRVPAEGGATLPLWRVWQKRLPAPDDLPTPMDRWHALVDYSAGSFPPSSRGAMKPEEVEAELASVPVGEELFSRIARVADDFAERFAAAARSQVLAHIYFAMSALLLLPLIRAGRSIEPVWDILVYVGKEPQSRELVGALPPERRERVLCDYMRGGSPATCWARAEGALATIDLCPTPEVARTFAWLLEDLAKRPGMEAVVPQLRGRFDDLAKSHAGLAAR